MGDKRIFWTESERQLLTVKAAAIYEIRGRGYGPAILQAQDVWLEPGRRKTAGSVSAIATKVFKPLIEGYLNAREKAVTTV